MATDSTTDTPVVDGRSRHSPPVLHGLRLSRASRPSGEDFVLIATHFAGNLEILISEIKWSGTLPRLRVPDGVYIPPLPFKLGGLPGAPVIPHHRRRSLNLGRERRNALTNGDAGCFSEEGVRYVGSEGS